MKRQANNHAAAKAEARQIMVAFAKRQRTISYSELAATIKSCRLTPNSSWLFQLLDEISKEEHRAGRGMLSAVVVHKSGDQIPGAGFFDLAESLGLHINDRKEFWIQELNRVYKAWPPRSNP